jgi:ABC-type transport system involved in cytochrome c biogenesis permease subunit
MRTETAWILAGTGVVMLLLPLVIAARHRRLEHRGIVALAYGTSVALLGVVVVTDLAVAAPLPVTVRFLRGMALGVAVGLLLGAVLTVAYDARHATHPE